MQPPDPPTPLEINHLQAYQMLGQLRIQQTVLHEAVVQCYQKCCDVDELFTLARTDLPISQRLKLDEKERNCVKHCSAKWDEAFRRIAQKLMRGAQDDKNFELMKAQYEQISQMSQGGK
jgi:hypothetical protein